MLTIQPPLIADYLASGEAIKIPKNVHRSFYLSWEDALWHILQLYVTRPGAVALVPEFYCGNVIEHMREHGLIVRTYPVNEKLQTPLNDFVTAIKQSHPDIVIIFHPVGITNPLTHQVDEWLPIVGEKAILIEDCVHRIIDPQKLYFFSHRHFAIDSLRKVVPVQGSNLYSSIPMPPTTAISQLLTTPYRLGVLVWWLIMQSFLVSAHYAKSSTLASLYNRLAEGTMLRGYKLIGKSRLPSRGIGWMDTLSRRIAIPRIEQTKSSQARLYRSALQKLIASNDHFWLPSMQVRDDKYLRGFPLIMDVDVAQDFLDYFRSTGIMLRFELNDSGWSERHKIVYFPMGPHISKLDIQKITHSLNTFALY